MADKQALNATFFAFKKRDRGGVLTTLSIAYLVLAIVLFGGFFALNAQGMMDYINWVTSMGAQMESAKPGDPSAMSALTPPPSVIALGPMYILFLFVMYILFAAYEAGCLRWMIRGETGGLFGLLLGADTWRVWFTYWVWFFLLIALYIVCGIVAGGVVFGVMMGSQNGAGPSGASVLIALAAGLAVIVALIYFAVRFAPAAATSIARKRFAFFDAWTVSKGRFWALFGAFLLLFVMFYVLIIIIEVGLIAAMGTTAMSQIGHTEPQSAEEAFRAFANPMLAGIVGGVGLVATIGAMMLYVALFGVNARAVLAALEEGKIKAAEA
jgi:hypothetical protein